MDITAFLPLKIEKTADFKRFKSQIKKKSRYS